MREGLSSPSLGVDGTIVIGFADGVYGVSQSGTQRWNVPVSAGVLSSAAIGSDGTIYFPADDGFLYALR